MALQLAELLAEQGTAAELIAMDSMTLYRDMSIGTAKPSAQEQAALPHHLIDVRGPHELCSVADYLDMAVPTAEAILSHGRSVLFVGGTGLYLRSLLRGVFEGPPADEAVRQRIEASGTATELHARLASVDPPAAAGIQPNDVRRTVRALEVLELTGRPISAGWDEDRPDTVARRVFWLEPDRAVLHRRINGRVDAMLREGWLQEAAALARRDPPAATTALQGLGYAELIAVSRGECSIEEAVVRIKARTRQFAKRQCTWFRNIAECRRVPITEGESPRTIARRLLTLGSL